MATTLEFSQPPAPGGAYLRALLGAGKPLRADQLPDLRAVQRRVTVQPEAVARFRQHFGLPAEGPVPPTLPHILLASPLHLQVLTHPSFPLRVLGTVHIRNPILQRRALRVGETVDVQVRMAGLRQVAQGLEHDMLTEVFDAQGDCIWTGTSTNLLRDPGKARAPRPAGAAPAEPPPVPAWERAWTFGLEDDAGRRYASLSGDWNPIHLTALSARLFGFQRAIIHGMYTYTKVAAVLEPHLPSGALRLDVQFRKPIFLPGTAVVRALRTNGQDDWQWAVQDRRGQILHAEGVAGPAD